MELIGKLDISQMENTVFVMDRGYLSKKMIDFLEQKHHWYMMHCPQKFLSEKKWKASRDKKIDYCFSKSKASHHLRVISFPLDNGDKEILITNIPASKLTDRSKRSTICVEKLK